MPEYFDYVLALIPLVLVGVSGALAVGGLALTTAVSAGALVSAALVAHALFVRGPTEPTDGSERATAASSERRPPTAD